MPTVIEDDIETVPDVILLDKEILEKWNWTDEDFKGIVDYLYNKPLMSTDKIVFKYCYEFQLFFPSW